MDTSNNETVTPNNSDNIEIAATTEQTAPEGGEEETEDDEEDLDMLEKELLEMEERGGDEGGDEMSEDDDTDAPTDDKNKKQRKRKNIRKMLSDDELAEETRLEQEREMERIRWLRELHEKSQAEEREKKKLLQEERKKQKSGDSSNPVMILVDDSDGETVADKKKVRKEPTVITLSSDESEPETDKPLTGYDDTTAFVGGMHTDDTKNVADSQARVLVNVNHPPDEPDIFLTPKLARTVKSHQIGGIRFLYDNIIESVSRFNASPGFGCILAHTMGLGKTLQTISFVDCCLRNTPAQCVLIVVPVNVLQNWINEFDMWVPENCPEANSSRDYPIYVINDLLKTFEARATLIKKWNGTGGCMILGYEMFRLLALTEPSYAVSRKLCRKRRKRGAAVKEVCDIEEEEFYMDLLKATQQSLLHPGPDLVVCDEGHRIKNAHATISKALKKIRTRRRIVLTGYPLQNNLEEYWCMVDFVRPNFLGTKNEFNNMFVRPIENGQCVDSTFKDTQLMKFRSHVLHSLLEGFVQRRDQSILQHTLQSKTEYVLCVKMTAVQRRLLKRFAYEMESEGSLNPIYAFTVLTKIWNHPDVLQEVVSSSKMDDLDVDLPKASTKLALDWAKDELVGMRRGVIEDGAKMVLLLDLIDESVAIGDKVVVFSQSLLTLSLIEKFLQQKYLPEGCTPKNDIRTYFNGGSDKTPQTGTSSPEYPAPKAPQVKWTKNTHYFRLDGSTNSQDREKLIRQFNKKGESALVFLISTRAGSLGVNLIGSNRVIIMDVSWNPCHDAQAVCRIYRYGQTKPSYVYRFVAENTLERTIYNKQITKQGMSSRVVDEQNVEKQFTSSEIVSNTDNMEMVPPATDSLESCGWKDDIPNITDDVLRSVIGRHADLLTAAPFTHESLLIENKNERLTQEEKMLAKKSYQFEKQMNKGYGSFSNTYSKPVNRVLPMCKAAPKSGPGPPVGQPMPPIDTTSGTWNNAAVPGVSLEEFAEKYNAANWSPLIKPLSPPQIDDDSSLRTFQGIPITSQEHQTYQARQQNPPTHPSRITNIAPKPRSILPAPPNPPPPPNPQQSFLMNPVHVQPTQPLPQLKLPLPRLTSHQQVVHPSTVAKRNRQQSKVVSSVRPTQAVLTQGEDGKCSYKVPIPRTPETTTTAEAPSPVTSTPNKSSITEALRAIDERIIEPPTVSVQRMIEENELLRKRMELDGYLTFSKSSTSLSQESVVNSSSPIPSTCAAPGDEDAKGSDLISTNDSHDGEKVEQLSKSKKKTSKRTNSQNQSTSQSQQQQVVYQAIPAQALQSNQGYQLLIQMPPGGNLPNQTKMVPATQLIPAQSQQLVNNTTQVMNGQQIFLQKQTAPMQQMQIPAGSKAVYMVSQPSAVTSHPVQTGQMVTSTVQSLGQYTVAHSQDSELKEEDATPSRAASTSQHDVVQQTPPPTLLSPVNYDMQPHMQSQQSQLQPLIQQHLQPHIQSNLQSRQVLVQQQQYQQVQFQQQPRYQNYLTGAQMIQPRFMSQQMYMQPSQIERVQQRPKLKPKPKSAPSKSRAKKTKTLSDDAQISQMHANILAQQKQRQLTQQMHQQTTTAEVYNNQRQSFPIQHPRYYSPTAIQQISPASGPVANEPSNYQVAETQDIKPAPRQLYYQQGFQTPMFQQQGPYGQFMTPQQIQQTFAGTSGKAAEKKPSAASRRKPKKKTSEETETRINIQIHSPIAFPMEKKPKKGKKSADCPYSQETAAVPTTGTVQQSSIPQMNYMQQQQHKQHQQQQQQQQQHQHHLYQNMMHMYRQQAPQQQPHQQQQLQNQQHAQSPHAPSPAGYQLQQHMSYQAPMPQQPPLLYKQYLQKPQPPLQEQSSLEQTNNVAPQYWDSNQYSGNYPSDQQQQAFQFLDQGREAEDIPLRTPSPHSDEEMDVNQFLNIPIKKETEETSQP